MITITTRDALQLHQPAAPRGARVAAELFTGLVRWLFRPVAQRPLSPAEEAATVRQLAYRIQHTDPGFAADLYAAAARHESQRD